MFVDASAIVAILNKELGWQEFAQRLSEHDGKLYVSPMVRYEAVLAVARALASKFGRRTGRSEITDAQELVADFFSQIGASEHSISSEMGLAAIEAASRYGKAVGHPADLNFGDCFAFACAKSLNVGLLYKGDDFAKTDLA